MSLTDLEIKKYTEPLEKELNKQKEKNGLLKKQAFMMAEDMREACAKEIQEALIEAGEDPRAADSMLRRVRGVELKKTPLRNGANRVLGLVQEVGVIMRVSKTIEEKRKQELIKMVEQARDILQDLLEDP